MKTFPPFYVTHEFLFTKPTTSSYAEPVKSSPLPPVVVLVFYVVLGYPSDLPSDFAALLYARTLSPIHAAFPVHINRDLIILTISG
jgi:hypothetical protein